MWSPFGGTILLVYLCDNQPRSRLRKCSADGALSGVEVVYGARVLQTGSASQLFDVGSEHRRCGSFARTRRQVRAVVKDKYQQVLRLIIRPARRVTTHRLQSRLPCAWTNRGPSQEPSA